MLADQLILSDSVDFVENLFTKTLSVYDEQQFINDLFKIPEQPTISEEPPKPLTLTAATFQPSSEHSLAFDPVFAGSINIGIKTQIQTNRRTNIYLDASWPEDVVNKKLPIHYYPPNDESIYEKIKNVEEPSQLWMTEISGNPYGQTSYVEVHYWMKNQDGKMQLISKCGTHPSLIKMNGQPYEEKAISHEEVKWSRNTMIFGVNFNCTRTCFKSEIYMFIRVRVGNSFFESGIIELPFRRSEKRKHDSAMDAPRASKRQIMKQIPKVVNPATKPLIPLLSITQLTGVPSTPVSIKEEPTTINVKTEVIENNISMDSLPNVDITSDTQVMDINFGDKQTALPLFDSPSVSYIDYSSSPTMGFDPFNVDVDFNILNVDSWDPD